MLDALVLATSIIFYFQRRTTVINLAPIAAVMLLKRWALCVSKQYLSGKRDRYIHKVQRFRFKKKMV